MHADEAIKMGKRRKDAHYRYSYGKLYMRLEELLTPVIDCFVKQ